MTAKDKINWRHILSNEEIPLFSVTDGFIDAFLKEFPELVRDAKHDEKRREELILKFEVINSFIIEGHQYFKDRLFSRWQSFNPEGINEIYARAAIEKGSMDDLLRYTSTTMNDKRDLSSVALQLYWQGIIVTPKNRDEIAKQFPELGLKNGTKLYNKYMHLSKRTNRTGCSRVDRTDDKHRKDMEEALGYLTDERQIAQAKKELAEFIDNLEKF